jgi:hypothetical protein
VRKEQIAHVNSTRMMVGMSQKGRECAVLRAASGTGGGRTAVKVPLGVPLG